MAKSVDKHALIERAFLLSCYALIFVILIVFAYNHISHLVSALNAVRMNSTDLDIVDNSTYAQVANAYVTNVIYHKIEKGVGYIYGPMLSWLILSLSHLLNFSPTPDKVRLVLYILFILTQILFGVILLKRTNIKAQPMNAFLIIVMLMIAIGFLHRYHISRFTIHPIYLLLTLLVLGYAIFEFEHRISGKTLIRLIVVWSILVWFTHIAYVVCAAAFLPLILSRVLKKEITAQLVIFSITSGILAIVAYYLANINSLEWTILAPFTQQRANIIKKALLYKDNFFMPLIVIIAFYIIVSLRDVREYSIGIYLLMMFIAATPGYQNIDGGYYSYTIPLYFSITILAAQFIRHNYMKASLSISVVCAAMLLLSPASYRLIKESQTRLQSEPAAIEKHPIHNIVHKVLKLCEAQDLSFYMDTYPAYYLSKKIPLEFHPCHMRELEKSKIYNTTIDMAFEKELIHEKWDILILRNGSMERAWGRRCLNDNMYSFIREKYNRIISIKPLKSPGHFFLNDEYEMGVDILFPKTINEKNSKIEHMIKEELRDYL